MGSLFIFTRKQRSSAILLVFNAVVALLLYLAAHEYLPNLSYDKNALAELFSVLDIAIWIIEAILIGLALWFWFENKEIRVCVTPTTLSYFDPTFSDVNWQVNVFDIEELKQVSDTRQDYFSNFIVLKNGEKKQLMYGNYRGFDRRKFFNALVLANPKISEPRLANLKISKPQSANPKINKPQSANPKISEP